MMNNTTEQSIGISSLSQEKILQVPTAFLERRKVQRYPCRFSVKCYASAMSAETWNARVEDVSDTGVGLLIDRYLEPNFQLVLELPAQENKEATVICVRVVRSIPVSNVGNAGNEYRVGCETQDTIPLELIRALMSSKQA